MESRMFCFNCCNKNMLNSARVLSADEFKKYLNAVYPTTLTLALLDQVSLDKRQRQEMPVSRCICEQARKRTSCYVETRQTRGNPRKQSPTRGVAQDQDKRTPDLSSVKPASLKVENITVTEKYRKGKLESDAVLGQALEALEQAVRRDIAMNSRHLDRLPEEHIDTTSSSNMPQNEFELCSPELSRSRAKLLEEREQKVAEAKARREAIAKEGERETIKVAAKNQTLTDEGKENHRLILGGSAELSVELRRCKKERQRSQCMHDAFESDITTRRCKELQQKLQSNEESSHKLIEAALDQHNTLKKLAALRQSLEDIVKNLKEEVSEYTKHIDDLQRIICARLTKHPTVSSDDTDVTWLMQAMLACHAERISSFIDRLECHGYNVNTVTSGGEVSEVDSNILAHQKDLHLQIAEKLEKSRQFLLHEKEIKRNMHTKLIRNIENVCNYIWDTIDLIMESDGRRIIDEAMEQVLCSRAELASLGRASQVMARMSQQLSGHCGNINDKLELSRELPNIEQYNIKGQEKVRATTQTDHFSLAEVSTMTANDQHENIENDYTSDESLPVHASAATNKTASQERQGLGANSAPGFREIATQKYFSETMSYGGPLAWHDWQCADDSQNATGSRQNGSNQHKANEASEANGAQTTVHLCRVEPAQVCDQDVCHTPSCRTKQGGMNSQSSITSRNILARISETSDAVDADVPVANDTQDNRQEGHLWDERRATSSNDMLSEKAPEEGSFVFASEVESLGHSSDIVIHYPNKGYARGERSEENKITTNRYNSDRCEKRLSKEQRAETFTLTNRTNDEPKKRAVNSLVTTRDIPDTINKENIDAQSKQDYPVRGKLRTRKSASMGAIGSAGTINAWVGKSPSSDSTYQPTVYSLEFLCDRKTHCRNADQQSLERGDSMVQYGGNQSEVTITDRDPGTTEETCKRVVGIDVIGWQDVISKLGDRNLSIKPQSVNISQSSFAGCCTQSRSGTPFSTKESQLEYKSIQELQATNLTTSATFLSGASEAKLAASKARFNGDDDEDMSDTEAEHVIPKPWPKGDGTDGWLMRKTEEPTTRTSNRNPVNTKNAEFQVPDKRLKNLHNTTGKRLSVSVGAIRRAATINAWAGKSPSYGETPISTPFSSQLTCDHEGGCGHAEHDSFPYRYVLYNAHSEADSGTATAASVSDACKESEIELIDHVDTDDESGQPVSLHHPLTQNNAELRAPFLRSPQPRYESTQALPVLQLALESSATYLSESSDRNFFESRESFDWDYHEKVADVDSELVFPVQYISDDALAGPSMVEFSNNVQRKRQQRRRVAYQRERSLDHSTGSTLNASASEYDHSFLNFEFKY